MPEWKLSASNIGWTRQEDETVWGWMKELGYHEGYRYPHDYAGHFVRQDYRPDAVKEEVLWQPADNAQEARAADRLRKLWGK